MGENSKKTILKLHRAIRPHKFRSNKSVTQAPNHITLQTTARIEIRKNTRIVHGKGITIHDRTHCYSTFTRFDFWHFILRFICLFPLRSVWAVWKLKCYNISIDAKWLNPLKNSRQMSNSYFRDSNLWKIIEQLKKTLINRYSNENAIDFTSGFSIVIVMKEGDPSFAPSTVEIQ